MSTHSRYVVGIDLGTTNSALAYIDTAAIAKDELSLSLNAHEGQEGPGLPRPQVLHLPQVVAPGQVEPRPVLPSFLYLSAPREFPGGALDLPWSAGRSYVVGEFARQHGVQVPMRLCSSAKSWLSYGGADRTAPILPPPGPPGSGPEEADLPRLSPVDVAARYLMHLRDAWDEAMAADSGSAQLSEQEVLLTVPASFDAVARELTVRAAHSAGLTRVTLLEEPQAAFYAFLGQHPTTWRQQLQIGDVVLVCDVGGGTTDFSLIAVTQVEGELQLTRVAVGDHILLGGDNMDLSLGVALLRRLEQKGHKLDPWQRRALVHSARQAKEALLSGSGGSAPVVVLGRGSKVIGGSIKTELSRADAEHILLDGFFPLVAGADRPRAARRSGLMEMGLPYAADPAVTRHLAKFLADHRHPTAILFNGGVMKARPLQRRIEQVLGLWGGQSAVRPLRYAEGEGDSHLDLAVALGAAYYGLVRRGKGLRIRGGIPRSYYIGVEATMPAVPGMTPPLRAVCVAPRGMEEGSAVDVPGGDLGLIVGEPVEFRFLSSSTRKGDAVGAVIEDVNELPADELRELAPVETVLAPEANEPAGTMVPVRLSAQLTEVGVLELFCVSRDSGRRWKLEYNVRERRAEESGEIEEVPEDGEELEDDHGDLDHSVGGV